MCGIFGIWHKDGKSPDRRRVEEAAALMRHRGPDARGYFQHGPLALAHCRLRIIDLSNAANQPFTDGTDTLVYNGELFNYRLLRKKLEASVPFVTNSDTEVVFRAIQTWGQKAFARMEGQFALAFHRRRDNSLLLARDHVGICPLYTYEDGETFIFASEIKPILHITGSRELDPQGLADYFAYRYAIQNGHTMFADIRRFPPAKWKVWHINGSTVEEGRYWRMRWSTPIAKEAVQPVLNVLLDKEMEAQSMADVPVGMFLSGGIDSRAVLHGLAPHAGTVTAFTMQFSPSDDELGEVTRLADVYPLARHTVPYSLRVVEELPQVVKKLEEPFGDVIICANDALAAAAARHVRVVLSGEGGDEAFFGYDHQPAFLTLSRFRASRLLCLCAKLGLKAIPPALLGAMQGYPGKFTACEKEHLLRVVGKIHTPGQAYLALSRLFAPSDLRDLFTEKWISRGAADADEDAVLKLFEDEPDLVRASMRAEIEQLLLSVNLHKQDRLSMSHSLETRVPLVSRNILDFVGTIPTDALLRQPRKRFLRDYAPGGAMPKKAFSVLTSPDSKKILRTLFDEYVSPDKVKAAGILSPESVANVRVKLERGSLLDMKRAMCILVFMTWHASFVDSIRHQ